MKKTSLELLRDPEVFIRLFYPDIKLWEKQYEIFMAIRDYRRVVVPSGYAVGKTFIASLIVLWYLYTHPDAIVLTTAPTARQVYSILWSQIRDLYRKARYPLGGELLQTQIKIRDRWFAMGLSTKEPERFQGYHEECIMLVFDEAPGIPSEIWQAGENIMTSEKARWLAIGNPVSLYDNFGQAAYSDLWKCIYISCLEHPNVKLRKVIYPKMVTYEWVEERRKEWGENHPLYISRVLGRFPTEAEDVFIPQVAVENAVNREVEESDEIAIGCDVARYGSDRTVIIVRQGNKVVEIISYQGQSLMWTAGKLVELYHKYNPRYLNIDDTGLGGGVTDRLREQKIPVFPVNFGAKSDNPYCDNKGTELWYNLKQLFTNQSISIPNHLDLKRDLVARRYKILSNGKISLESKDELKSRGLNSPDFGDALALAFYVPKEEKVSLKVLGVI